MKESFLKLISSLTPQLSLSLIILSRVRVALCNCKGWRDIWEEDQWLPRTCEVRKEVGLMLAVKTT
jgi:hypothetical protein